MSAGISSKTHQIKNKTSIQIREAQIADAANMLELAKSVFNSSEHTLTTAEEFTLTVEDEIKVIESHQQNDGHIYLLAQQDNQLIGMLNFQNGNKRKGQHVGEFAMGIRDSHRNLGIGSLLLETLLEWADKNPLIYKINLSVFINNSNAIRLYKNHGFMEEGRKRNEIKVDDDVYIDLVLMCRFV